MLRNSCFFILCLLTCVSRGQNLAAYTDNNGYFYIFDNGNTTLYEYNKPLSWQVGTNCVAFVDYNSTFKVYWNGEIYKPIDRMISNYTVTRGAVEFLCKGNWNGRVKDSVAVYAMPGYFYIFNKGTIHVADDIYPSEYKMDGNTVAWIDPENNLKAFYNGEICTLTTLIRPTGFSVAGNTVWFNTASGGNHVFWKGKIY